MYLIQKSNTTSDDVLMTVEETAAFVGCSRAKVARMLRDGHLPGIRIGRSWRVPRGALVDALLAIAKQHWKLPEGLDVALAVKPVLVLSHAPVTASRKNTPRVPTVNRGK